MIDIGVNGYIDVAEFKLWADARGYDYSAKTDQQIEQAITIASVDYIDTRYVFNGDGVNAAPSVAIGKDVAADNLSRSALAISRWLIILRPSLQN